MEKLQLISDLQVDSVDLNYEEVRSQELLMKRGAGQIPRLDRKRQRNHRLDRRLEPARSSSRRLTSCRVHCFLFWGLVDPWCHVLSSLRTNKPLN